MNKESGFLEISAITYQAGPTYKIKVKVYIAKSNGVLMIVALLLTVKDDTPDYLSQIKLSKWRNY